MSFVAKLPTKQLYLITSALLGGAAGWFGVRAVKANSSSQDLESRLDEALRSEENGSTFKLWGVTDSASTGRT